MMALKKVTNILNILNLRTAGAKEDVEKRFLTDKWERDKSLYKKVENKNLILNQGFTLFHRTCWPIMVVSML